MTGANLLDASLAIARGAVADDVAAAAGAFARLADAARGAATCPGVGASSAEGLRALAERAERAAAFARDRAALLDRTEKA